MDTIKKREAAFTVVYDGPYKGLKITAVNKTSGLSVGGDRWDESKERLDKLTASALGIQQLYTVHRIDKETSGLVVFAKDKETHRVLCMAFEGREVKKRYIAVIHGRPSWTETACDLPLVPNGNKLHHTVIDKYRGKPSLTRFRLLGSAGNYSVLEAVPETGRTHQIRIHLASMGHPIVCDEMYGNTKPVFLSAIKRGWRGDAAEELPLLSRLGLHGAELFLPGHEAENECGEVKGLHLEAPLSRDIAALIKQMEKAGKFVSKVSGPMRPANG
ncbi:MAG: RNA pseudouridine synthase [Treponema sp.]|nr:RNA pseudouridine synthase [Treponema sp.]